MTQTATRTDKLKAAHEKLTAAVESIVSGDDWQRMLKVVYRLADVLAPLRVSSAVVSGC